MTHPTHTYGQFWTKSQTIAFVNECFDRDMLIQVLLNYASQWHKGRLLCLITRTHIQPFMAQGWVSWGSDDETMRMLMENRFSLDKNALLHAIIEQGVSTYGTPEDLGFDDLLEEASVMRPEVLVLIPIVLGGKTKMVFLGERDQAPQDMEEFREDIDPLSEVCAHVAQQLEQMILAAKQGTLPPEAQRIPAIPQAHTPPTLTHLTRPQPRASDSHDSLAAESTSASSSLGLAHSSTEGSQKPAAPSLSSHDYTARQTQPISLDELRAHQREHVSPSPESQAPSLSLSDPMDVATTMVTSDSAGHDAVSEDPGEEEDAIMVPPGSVSFDQEEQEHSGVFVIQPIAIEEKEMAGKKTLLGGYSREDIERAKEMFLKSHAGKETLMGVQAPLIPGAQIFKRKKVPTQKMAPVPSETQKMIIEEGTFTHDAPPPLPPSVSTQNFRLDFSALSPPSEAHSTPKLDTISVAASAPEEEEDPSSDPFQTSRGHRSSPHIPSLPAAPSALPPAQVGPAQPPAEFTAPSHDDQGDDDEHTSSAKTLKLDAIPLDPSSTQPSSTPHILDPLQERVLRELGARDSDASTAAKAATALEPSPEVLSRLATLFPGRLLEDRYQYPVDRLPDVQSHGPLLSTLVQLGEEAVSAFAEHLNSQSLDRRFYATFLFTQIDPIPHLASLVPRLFDRDSQTREVAFGILLDHRGSDAFGRDVLPELHRIVERSLEESRVEIAAELIGQTRNLGSVNLLIAALDRHRERTNQAIHRALQRITLQPLPQAGSIWQTWQQQHPPATDRTTWILLALNSPNATIRQHVSEELANAHIEGFSYSPYQPASARIRAQHFLEQWIREHGAI